MTVHAEMEAARQAFYELVAHVTPDGPGRRSSGTRWTNRQLLLHMVFGYLIVRALMPLVQPLGRPGWSRRFAAALNAFARSS